MNSKDPINYSIKGFDNNKYLETQKNKILERIDQFRDGKLYMEIGGKFLSDPHASRVLAGFEHDVKQRIFSSMRSIIDLFFCVNARDISSNRSLNSTGEGYVESVMKIAEEMKEKIGVTPIVVINLCDRRNRNETKEFEEQLDKLGYTFYKRYLIDGYPTDSGKILSEEGYGSDEYIQSKKKLILVTGAASNSGKMSTCLGQIYLDHQEGIQSGYTKYETFPIWSLPISHPINLAYEAATVDIGDYNVIDTYHEQAYGQRAVNYNRDTQAFEIIINLTNKFLDETNPMKKYKSPTDMGINFAGSAITDDQVVCVASLHEIRRRRGWYQDMVDRGTGERDWVRKCDNLEKQAIKYIKEKGYNPEFKLY